MIDHFFKQPKHINSAFSGNILPFFDSAVQTLIIITQSFVKITNGDSDLYTSVTIIVLFSHYKNS